MNRMFTRRVRPPSRSAASLLPACLLPVCRLAVVFFFFFFFFNDTATPEIYPLPLHDALPISLLRGGQRRHQDHAAREQAGDCGLGHRLFTMAGQSPFGAHSRSDRPFGSRVAALSCHAAFAPRNPLVPPGGENEECRFGQMIYTAITMPMTTTAAPN